MEIWFGTADDSLTRDVIFKGRPGRFCSIPFFGGGAYPYGKKRTRKVLPSLPAVLRNRLVRFKQMYGKQVNLDAL